MKRIALALLLVVLSSALLVGPAAARRKSCTKLPTPSSFSCQLVATAINCSWLSVSGATKYSVDADASYVDLTTDPPESLSVETDFGAAASPISIPLSSFQVDPDNDGDTDTLVSVVLKVKALNPPTPGCPQNNPFSLTQTINLLQ